LSASLTSLFSAAIYSTIIAALFSLIKCSCLATDAWRPAAVLSIFLSNNADFAALDEVEA
jgi:hypothetical protein